MFLSKVAGNNQGRGTRMAVGARSVPTRRPRSTRRAHDVQDEAIPGHGRHRWRVLADDLASIRDGGVLSGVPAADARWFDVVAADALPKVYVARSRVEELIEWLLPLERSTQPNVEVLVPTEEWVLGSGVTAPDAVIAADLLLDIDPRVRRAAEHHLESLQAAWKVAHDRDS